MKNSKKILFFLVAAITLMPFISQGKSGGVRGFYDKYADRKGFTSLNIEPDLVQLFAHLDDGKLKQMLKHVKQVKMLTYSSDPDSIQYFADELKGDLLAKRYEDLLMIKKENNNIEFKINKKGHKIRELIMIESNASSLTVFYIEGDIDLEKVKELSRS